MSYFTFFKSISFSLTFLDLFLFVIFYYVFFCYSFLFNQYLYFFAIGLLFAVIFLIGWLGFILSFLILLILYSTLVVVFWSFFIAFEETSFKQEKKRTSVTFLPFLAFLFFYTENWNPTTLQPFQNLYCFDFFQVNEANEFFFFFLIIYVYNPVTFLFIFFTLLFVCFNIVSLFLIKHKTFNQNKLIWFNFNVNQKAPFTQAKSGRSGFWETVSSNVNFLTLNKTQL